MQNIEIVVGIVNCKGKNKENTAEVGEALHNVL
jgi:hypothetical protein